MNVVRLIPLQRPYADALAAFLQGRHVRCLSLLHGHDSLEASLLRARAFLRMRRFDEAHAELTQPTLPLGDHARCAEFQFLLGTTLARIGKIHEANEALAVADAYATSSCDSNLVTEVASYRAFTAFLCGNYDEVQEIASEALSEHSGSAHARLLEMLGFVAALRGDSESQLMMLLAANEHLRQLPSRDTYLEANMLNNLAVAVIEADPSGLAAYIRARASEIEWHDELGLLHFHLTHHLGWLDALGGDELSAFRHFRTAIDEAVLSRGGTIVLDAHKESVAGRPAVPCERQTDLHAAFTLGLAQQAVRYHEVNCVGAASSGEVRIGSFTRDFRSFSGSFWRAGAKLGDFDARKRKPQNVLAE